MCGVLNSTGQTMTQLAVEAKPGTSAGLSAESQAWLTAVAQEVEDSDVEAQVVEDVERGQQGSCAAVTATRGGHASHAFPPCTHSTD